MVSMISFPALSAHCVQAHREVILDLVRHEIVMRVVVAQKLRAGFAIFINSWVFFFHVCWDRCVSFVFVIVDVHGHVVRRVDIMA